MTGHTVYTPELREQLFIQAKATFGMWDRRKWLRSHRPAGLSESEFQAKCEEIRLVLAKKFGEDKAPASARSIMMAIFFTLHTNVQFGERRQPLFRMEAYNAGFITLGDILWMEEEQKANIEALEEHNKILVANGMKPGTLASFRRAT